MIPVGELARKEKSLRKKDEFSQYKLKRSKGNKLGIFTIKGEIIIIKAISRWRFLSAIAKRNRKSIKCECF